VKTAYKSTSGNVFASEMKCLGSLRVGTFASLGGRIIKVWGIGGVKH
jgi:hypothetical protein